MEREMHPKELAVLNRKDARDLIPKLGHKIWHMYSPPAWREVVITGVNVFHGTVTVMTLDETEETTIHPMRPDGSYVIKIKD